MKTNRVIKTVALALIAAALTSDAQAMCCGGFKNPFRRRAPAQVAPVDEARDEETADGAGAAGAAWSVAQELWAAFSGVNRTSDGVFFEIGRCESVFLIGSHIKFVRENNTGLHFAAIHNYVSLTRSLIAAGNNVNKTACLLHGYEERRDRGSFFHNCTPLDIAVWYARYEIAKLLIDAGAKHEYATPLHLAAHIGRPEAVADLLRAGANVNANSPHGTPLHYAAKRYSDSDKVVRLLLAAGAKIVVNDEGRTPLDVANGMLNYRVLEILRSAAAAGVGDGGSAGAAGAAGTVSLPRHPSSSGDYDGTGSSEGALASPQPHKGVGGTAGDDARPTCCICLESLGKSDQNRMLSCGHVFHNVCIGIWFKQNTSCPMCRSKDSREVSILPALDRLSITDAFAGAAGAAQRPEVVSPAFRP